MRIFDRLMVFDGTENNNKDWIEGVSEKDYPSYSMFDIQDNDDVLIRVSTAD